MSTSFGQYIRDLRKAKHLTQRDLAEQVGVDATYLSNIERGHMKPPSLAVIQLLAYSLDIDEYTLARMAGKVPASLRYVLIGNPDLTELVRVLSQRKLPDEVYAQLLAIVRKSETQP